MSNFDDLLKLNAEEAKAAAGNPQIAFPLFVLDRVKSSYADLEKKNEELNKLLKEHYASDPLMQFARAALPIVQFAVGNLPPAAIKGWPHAKLTELATLLPKLPDASVHDRELAEDLRHFATEAADIEMGKAISLVAMTRRLATGIPNGRLCSQCKQAQIVTSQGTTCPNLHANDPGVDASTNEERVIVAEALERAAGLTPGGGL